MRSFAVREFAPMTYAVPCVQLAPRACRSLLHMQQKRAAVPAAARSVKQGGVKVLEDGLTPPLNDQKP